MKNEGLPCQRCQTRPVETDHARFCPPCQRERWNRSARQSLRRQGDRWETPEGYVYVRLLGSAGALEHRIIMTHILGRPLRPEESVHHKNGVRNDNRPENLELWVDGIRYGQRASEIVCPHCGKSYI